MKTYEDFLVFLEEHLKDMVKYVPASDRDFSAVCYAVGRFLLADPYKKEIFMDCWPSAEVKVDEPTREELTAFFKTHKGLPLSFRKELLEEDYDVLYRAYGVLYPMLVLKHEFLTSIFRHDMARRRYKHIFRNCEKTAKRIIDRINELKKNPGFVGLVEQFATDLSGFSITLINNRKLLDQVVGKLGEGAG